MYFINVEIIAPQANIFKIMYLKVEIIALQAKILLNHVLETGNNCAAGENFIKSCT